MKNNTINKKEIEKFSRIAEEWWDPLGKFKPLHKFNPIRISYIKENIINSFNLKNEDKPLKRLKILDIGCGGGLLSEPMCRLGADVTGIDASEKNIKFDVILNMEIIEHVDDVNFFLKSCSSLIRKGGLMFVATINKTLKSYVFAIIGAEYVLRWLPIGTHEWEKFVNPNDLINISKKYNLNLKNLDGMKFNIVKDEWSLSNDKSINYIGKFIKN